MDKASVSERDFALEELERRGRDLAAVYVALGRMQHLVENDPEVISQRAVSVIFEVLSREEHTERRTAYFLYRKAADALAQAVTKCPGAGVRTNALQALQELVCVKDGPVHRAVAEALGSLPLGIRGPEVAAPPGQSLPEAAWGRILEMAGGAACGLPEFQGRSMVLGLENGRVLVIKMARASDPEGALAAEAAWMQHLLEQAAGFPVDFHVPQPLVVDGSAVFRLKSPPDKVLFPEGLHPEKQAMAYVAHADYFTYPNDDSGGGLPGGEEFLAVLSKNAWLLGRLGSGGMVHTAPIPLFHNRVQAGRRNDQGVYQWPRQGRLDQWLFSCRYPNLCSTGLRDFEHILSFSGSMRELYLHLGTHVLSLVLVAGSYFRNKEPERVGLDPEGKPVDARDLFDRDLLIRAVGAIFFDYYRGFVGSSYAGALPRDGQALADAMIREMGVDLHMEEILRVQDQQALSREQFESFLVSRGYSPDKARSAQQGLADIVIHTGPHLGGFNQAISLPELICFVATVTSLCVSGKYLEDMRRPAA